MFERAQKDPSHPYYGLSMSDLIDLYQGYEDWLDESKYYEDYPKTLEELEE